MAAKFASRTARIVHEAVADAHRAGVVEKTTMRTFDEMCLAKATNMAPQDIQALRERAKVSQAVFAHYLNVTPGLISQWERGERRPSGPALTLLSLISRKGLEILAS